MYRFSDSKGIFCKNLHICGVWGYICKEEYEKKPVQRYWEQIYGEEHPSMNSIDLGGSNIFPLEKMIIPE